jgi:uncharacterized membrane protein YcaP (DUF421 family)
MLFDDWAGIGRTILVGMLAYVALVVLIRMSGKRTLAKMNAFDLVVTVALGSTLATILLSKDVALAEGVAAFMTLIGLQFVIAWLSSRSKRFERLVKSEPSLLLYNGRFLAREMRAERVTQQEVVAALRSQGVSCVGGAAAVVLETDGSFTVLPRREGSPDTLANVEGLSAAQRADADDDRTAKR